MSQHQLILSLGGNLGNKFQIFHDTYRLIERNIGVIAQFSSIYETPPWGFKSKNIFWNQVVIVSTLLKPMDVLSQINGIEQSFGRNRLPGKYISRKMDLDILFYDELVMDGNNLIIPHPQIEKRRFVLVPLDEIIPDFIHPRIGIKINELLKMCDDKSEIIRITPMKKTNEN